MIRAIEITNYRCYKHLKLENVKRLNVIVGDNGSGKTALLESIFFALAATTQLALRFRQQRGLDSTFHGTTRKIEEAVWGELFHDGNEENPVHIVTTGDGVENRSITIARGNAENEFEPTKVGLKFINADGRVRILYPNVQEGASGFQETGEAVPDYFYFAASSPLSSIENAGRFSDLSKSRRQEEFVNLFADEYKWIEDINIEVVAGAPALFGTLHMRSDKIPLPNISSGINRMVAILVAIASRTQSIVLVDEIENGVYYKHQSAIWSGVLKMLRQNDGQMFTTTHSKECLEALVDAAGDSLEDIALWRIERGPDGPEVLQFSGETLRAGIEHGSEIRSPDDFDD